MAKKWERAGQYAGAGAGVGGAIGSVIPVIGTGIGAAVGGALGAVGGFIGGSVEDGNDAEEQERLKQEQLAQQSESRKDAFNRYLLGEAAALGGDQTLLRAKAYSMGMQDLGQQQETERKGLQSQFDAYNETSPQAFVGLANAGAQAGQGLYKQFGSTTPMSAPAAGSGGGMGETVNPADLSRIAAPTYTPSKIADPSLSPEVQDEFDAANLAPLRKGRRVGF